MGHSALVIPVPALEHWVKARHLHYDADYVSADPTFAHAHITVLAPFVSLDDFPESSAQVAQILAAVPSFEFSLSQVATFPNGIIHLIPDSVEPFAHLTRALAAAFPAYPPYAGAFGHVTPHLTLDAIGPGVTEALVHSWVRDLLPVKGYAVSAQRSWYEAGACRTVASWRLGRASTVGAHSVADRD